MIDIKLVRENPQLFKDGAKAKRFDVNIDTLLDLDSKILAAKQMLQDIVTEKNRIGKEIPKLQARKNRPSWPRTGKAQGKEAALNEELKRIQPEFDALMLEVPQPPSPDVPLGLDDTENVELYKRGEVRKFDFEPKDHMQLGQALDMIDMERGVKLAGTRIISSRATAPSLHRAVMNFAMDFMISRGYTPMIVPLLMRNEAMRAPAISPAPKNRPIRWNGMSSISSAPPKFP
jgi:seryl-tRNA synthetase